jgi:predicted permease
MMLHDLRYAFRLLRKTPATTIIAVLTIAIGVGANAAIFSVIRAVLLKPLPYADAERLVRLAEKWPNLTGPRPASKLNYRDWAAQNTVFEGIAAVSWGSVTVNEGAQPVHVNGSLVSASYFDLFGLRAAVGRTFEASEDQPGHEHVVVLSHRLWASQFGMDTAVVGRPVRLDGEVYTIIGVMPARTSLDFLDPQLWRPLTFDVLPPRSAHELQWSIAKLKPGVTLEQARSQMDAIGDRLAREYPESNKNYGVVVEPFPRPVGIDVEASLYLLFAAVGAVLLIACVNLANLALARGAARAPEVAIRAALGAGRGRLVRQFLTEHLVIAVGGGLCGVAVSYAVLAVMKSAIPTTGLRAAFPPDTVIAMDAPVWLFALGLSVLSGIACGLAPALGATRLSLTEAIKGDGGLGVSAGRGQHRVRQMLVVTEIALAFVLLMSAALLIQSFFALTHRIDAGFDSTNVLTAGLPNPPTRFKSGAALNAYLDAMASRIQSLPGIRDVAFADALPTQGTPYGKLFQIAGQPAVPYGNRPLCGFKVVSPSYFRAVGLRLIEGRVLSERDRDGAPLVVVINRTMARTYFGGTDPVGQQVLIRRFPVYGMEITPDLAWTIVGVAADEGVSPVEDRTAQPAVYATREQHPRTNLSLVVRSTLDPIRVQASIRQSVSAFDHDQALADLQTLDQLKTDDVAPDRLRSGLLSAFAAVAVVLAAMGLYGVIAYTVAQRTREIGIRAALGASTASLLALVMRQGMAMIGVGLGTGLGTALIVTRLLRTFLFGIGPSDPMTIAAVASVLTGVALVACCVPARRATRIDPLIALKSE